LPAIVVLCIAVRAAAQVRGVVTDEAGRPLSDAVVDLWTQTTRVGRATTGAEGQFRFVGGAASRIVVRRIGSLSLVLPLGASDSVLTIHLVPAPVEVAAIEVSGACSNKGDRAARQRWETAAAWYRPLADTLWVEATFKGEPSRVRKEEAERPDIDSTGYGNAGYRNLAIESDEAAIARFGYPAPDPERDEVFSSSLVPAELQHLVNPAFGRRVRFTTLDEQRIRFCPRDRRHPWIEGEFKLGDDGSILWARWRYGSKVQGWETGGVATFLPPAADRSMPLLTSTFLIWQERTSGIVARWAAEFSAWRVSKVEPRDWHH
jgi:hypothetical protein